MRQIATLPDETTARRFADYLLTLDIDTQLDRDSDGIAIWVRDEDKVGHARQELEAFNRAPSDARYIEASAAAARLRQQEQVREEAYQRRQFDLERKMAGGGLRTRAVTVTLIVASVVAALLTNLGKSTGPTMQALQIAPTRIVADADGQKWVQWDYLNNIRHGEVWRLVTPIFIHYGLIHLAFNMFWLFALGGQIEARRGSVRLLLLVLVAAVLSNVSQYYLGHLPTIDAAGISLSRSPLFGGMSGVVYALFGYMWVKARFEPDLGLEMPRETVLMMLAWFFLCIADNAFNLGIIGPVGNTAHGVGLVVGMVVAFAPLLWRRG